MKGQIYFAGFIVFILLCVLGWFAFSSYYASYEITATIQNKFIDNSGYESHYLLRTDKGVLEVNRVLWDWNPEHNADMIYSDIQINETCKMKAYGWYIEWFYMYPNVYEVESCQ
jgi:hypothetical protein